MLNACKYALLTVCVWPAVAALAAEPATQPASQPASEIVLVKVGSTVITQQDFNNEARTVPPERMKTSLAGVARALVSRQLFALYLQDHADLIDTNDLEKRIQPVLKQEGVKNLDEFREKFKAQNATRKLEDFLDRVRFLMATDELTKRAEAKINDSLLKQTFDADPAAYDGTRVRVRQILIATAPFETPAQLKAKRDHIQALRDDIVSGRKTWEQCIDESDDIGTRVLGGDVGYVPRHGTKPEPFAKAAFALKPGETSDIIETPMGYHILQITDLHKGQLSYEQAKSAIRTWLLQKPIADADEEVRAKYEVVGVRPPDMPPPPPAPASAPARATPRGAAPRMQARPATQPGQAVPRAPQHR